MQITPMVWMLRFDVVNAYAVRTGAGFAVIDTGPRGVESEILDVLATLDARAQLVQIVLTHSHKDHAGSARALADVTGAHVLAGEGDALVIAGTRDEPPPQITPEEQPYYDRVAPMIPPAPAAPVDRVLREGDDLGWDVRTQVIEVPGHTPGSIAIFLPGEGILFTGDNVASLGGRAILGPFNVEREAAIASFRRLADLDVRIACFGHGDPIIDNAQQHISRASRRL